MTDTAPSKDQEWLDWRRGGIGSSDVAAAATGLYGGEYKVIASRLGIMADEIPQELADRGHRWEGPIADGITAHTGLYVGGEQLWLERDDRPRHRATPDGLLFPTDTPTIDEAVAGLEIKTRGAMSPWPWDYYLTQSQWQMYVAGLPRWLLVVATIDSELDEPTGALTPEIVTDIKYRWVYADELLHANLVDYADGLLAKIDAGQLPEPTGPEALPWVKAANATADPIASADIDDLADLIERYEALKAAAKAAEDERKTAEAVLRARMGEATEATTSDGAWRVRCGLPVRKFTAQSEIDWLDLYAERRPELTKVVLDRAAAKAEMPDEYDELRFPTPDRRLTIKHMEDS